jgi:RHS repeat-associated protein
LEAIIMKALKRFLIGVALAGVVISAAFAQTAGGGGSGGSGGKKADCEDCPKIKTETQTNIAWQVYASDSYWTLDDDELVYTNLLKILSTNFNQQGSQWQVQGEDGFEVIRYPVESTASTDSLTSLIGEVQAYTPESVENEFNDNMVTAQMWADTFPEIYEEPEFDENSFSIVPSDPLGFPEMSGNYNNGTATLIYKNQISNSKTQHNITISCSAKGASYKNDGYVEATPPNDPKIIDNWNIEVTCNRRRPTRYRFHYVAPPGQPIKFDWDEGDADPYSDNPYGPNYNWPVGYSSSTYTFGSPSQQNPNNGTIPSQSGYNVGVVGGLVPLPALPMPVLGTPTIVNPGYNMQIQPATKVGSAPTEALKNSHSDVGTGRVQHTKWYLRGRGGGVGDWLGENPVKAYLRNRACHNCSNGREVVEQGTYDIDLGVGQLDGSAGHLSINPLQLLGVDRTQNYSDGVDSGIDEDCYLHENSTDPDKLDHGVGLAVMEGGRNRVGDIGRQIQAYTGVGVYTNQNGTASFTLYPPTAMDTNTPYWTVKSGSNHLARWTMVANTTSEPRTLTITKMVPGESNQVTTYTYDTATKTLTFEPPLARTDNQTTINTSGQEEETITQKNGQGEISRVLRNVFETLPGAGRRLVTSIEDPDGAALTTTRDYYTSDTSPNEPAKWGKLRTVVGPTGGWTRYEYDAQGRPVKELTGRDNIALPTQIDENDCIVTEYNYAKVSTEDDSTDIDTARTTTVKYGTTPISRAYAILTKKYTRHITCTDPNAAVGSAGNLTNTIWLCTEGAVWTLGRVRKIDYADGRREVHFYEFPNDHVVVETVLLGQPDPNNIVNVIKGTRTLNARRANGKPLSVTVQDIETSATLANTQYSDFDANERPRRVDYLDGSHATINYACCGVDSIQHSDGTSVHYQYDARKRLEYETHSAGARTLTLKYHYDGSDEVTAVTRQWDTEGAASGLSGSKYDRAGRIKSFTNAALNQVTHYNYAIANGQETITTTYPDLTTRIETYNRDGSLAKVTGTGVVPGRYAWGVESVQGTNRIYRERVALNQNNTEPGYWAKSYLDASLRPVKTASAANNPIHFSYDVQGRVAKIANADGQAALRTYDALGRPELSVLDLHGDGQLHLDGSNRVAKTESQVVLNDAGAGETVYRVRSYVWPTVGVDSARLAGEVKVSLDGQRVWKTIYNDGVPVTSKSGYGFEAATEKYYHTNTAPNGTMTRTITRHGLLLEAKVVEANGTVLKSETYTYDVRNRLETITDTRNIATLTYYDNTDYIKDVMVSPAPGFTGVAQTTTYFYDAYWRIARTRLPDGSNLTNEYHPNGLLARRFGSQTYATGYAYDDMGRMTRMTNWVNAASPEVTVWNYNGTSGRLESLYHPDKTTGAPVTSGTPDEAYTYTDAGRLKTKTTKRGIVTTYGYNKAGALTKVSFAGESGTPTPEIVRTYNRLGWLTQINHAGQVMTRDYNHAGQLLSEAYTAGPLAGMSVARTYTGNTLQPATMTALNGTTPITGMGYGFTPAGGGAPQARLQSITGGPGDGIQFGYANNASLVEAVNYQSGGSTWVGRSMQYDFLNRLKQISTQFGDTHNYEFDELNRRKKDTLGDGSRWEYAYDQLGQLTGATNYQANGTAKLNGTFTYTSDGIGNVLTAQSPTVGGGESLSFVHNRQNQLTSVPHSGTTPFIGQVNAAANLSVLADLPYGATTARQGVDYRVGLATGITNVDRYVAFTNYAVLNTNVDYPDVVASEVVNRFLPKDATETLTYDNDGNLTADGRWDYTWDALNRLTGMESKSTAPTNSKHKLVFTYDAGGRRIQKEDHTWNPVTGSYQLATTTKFLYDGWDLVAELDGSGNALRSYGWLGKAGGLLWVKDHASGEFHVPSFDGNRNVTRLIQFSDRSVSAEYEYGPYGTLLRATGPMALANPIRFSSEYQDEVTGLVYYGYRYYAPETRRWLSKDPIGFAGGLNLYGFVGGDPVNGVDWLGMLPLEDCMGVDLHGDPEAEKAYRETQQQIGAALGISASSMLPGVGEYYDFKTLFGEDSVWWERALAGASLSANASVAGVAPNAGAIIQAIKKGRRPHVEPPSVPHVTPNIDPPTPPVKPPTPETPPTPPTKPPTPEAPPTPPAKPSSDPGTPPPTKSSGENPEVECPTPEIPEADRYVIGRGNDLADPNKLRPGESPIDTNMKFDPKKGFDWNWENQNRPLLDQAMAHGRPIRDVSPFDPGGGYLNAERAHLAEKGWIRVDDITGETYWFPPFIP